MLAARVLGLGVVTGCLIASCSGSSVDLGQGAEGGASGDTAHAGSAAQEAGFGGESVARGTSSAGAVNGAAGGGGASEAGATGSSGEGGAGGEGGAPQLIDAGLIVVGTTVRAATTRHFVVLIDPSSGQEIARTETSAAVLVIAYEAARDKWFVFTGQPGLASTTGSLLVGTMTTAGFAVEQTVSVPKPSNQVTVAMLNQRILYRSATQTGLSQADDVLTLLDTSGAVTPIGTLTIPYHYALVSTAGSPNRGQTPGGRVFFLHDNLDDVNNCVAPTVGTEMACTVYESSLVVAAADTNLSLPLEIIAPLAQIDRDGSDAALGVQPSGGRNVAIVLPPRRAVDTHASVFLFDANTGAAVPPALKFSLETATKKVDPMNSITIPTLALDPCADRLFTGELANTALLYAVPFAAPDSTLAFDPASADNIVGVIAYEPFTHTLISANSDSVKPTFSGLEIGGSVTAPQVSVRGTAGAAPWRVPVGLEPDAVAVKNPVDAPCAP